MPFTVALWALVLGLVAWQTNHEKELRRKIVESQLNLVNQRTGTALESGSNELTSTFLRFIERFYIEHPLFSDIRVTIYNSRWDAVRSVGTPIVITEDERKDILQTMVEREPRVENPNRSTYFYLGYTTPSGNHHIVSALPNGPALEKFLNGNRHTVWLFVIGALIVMTALMWVFVGYITKNISILRDFADRAASDPAFIPGTDFPHDELGDVARRIVTIFNERSKARRRLNHEHSVAMNAIRERAVQKRQLTNNINHELKTPIGVIKGYLDTLVENEDLDDETRTHFIRKARDHANRLAELIADIAAITRLEEGANMINTEVFDYHDLVFQFANDIRESGTLGEMEFSFDIPIGTYVQGNGNLLTAMLMNLAKNAANYSGGSYCRLILNRITPDGTMYEFSFYDDGSGVPADALPHLFDRFYRVDSGRARKKGGTGLGLAIVENTITAHNGTVKGLNRDGEGLEIVFTLPRSRRPG